ncbi:MAG: hypothetical protein V3U42_08565 [candidate division NC10 bacterium]|nr:hypothetical protein [candidate division NC10 bacterium]MCH7895382.1 hypothetical protein [candidate division NC10 bacterium]MCZ6551610.1 hypothetical protein [candidate division NC10 bacterium]
MRRQCTPRLSGPERHCRERRGRHVLPGLGVENDYFIVEFSAEERIERLADPSRLGDLDEDNPQSIRRWVKRMGKEMGDELGKDVEPIMEEALGEEAGPDTAPDDEP